MKKMNNEFDEPVYDEEKNSGGTKKKGKSLLFFLLGVMVTLVLVYCGTLLGQDVWKSGERIADVDVMEKNVTEASESQEEVETVKSIKIDTGIEVKTDINGDGVVERVYVKDYSSGDGGGTLVVAEFKSGKIVYTEIPGAWDSKLVSGDLNEDDKADIAVVQTAFGSNYGGGQVVVFHFEDSEWQQYPATLLKNDVLDIDVPENFSEGNLDVSTLGASIVKQDNKTLLRLIFDENILDEVVKCVDCSYQEDGWYIENARLVTNYYENNRNKELLNVEWYK